MAKKMDKFFQNKKINTIERAFSRQCELSLSDENDINKDCEPTEDLNDWLKQKIDLEDKIKVLIHENKDLKLKYEKVKSKHMKLLQVLLCVEEKNQRLEMQLQEQQAFNKSSSENHTNQTVKTDVMNELYLLNIVSNKTFYFGNLKKMLHHTIKS